MKNSKKKNKKKLQKNIANNMATNSKIVDTLTNMQVDEAIKILKENMKAQKESNQTISKDGLILYQQEDKLSEYEEVINSIKALETRKKDIEKEIQNEMKDYEVAYIGDKTITWKNQIRSSFDSRRFKLEYPELAEEFMKNTTYRVFKLK